MDGPSKIFFRRFWAFWFRVIFEDSGESPAEFHNYVKIDKTPNHRLENFPEIQTSTFRPKNKLILERASGKCPEDLLDSSPEVYK